MATKRWGTPPAQAIGALVLIHGRGSSAESIAGLADALQAAEFALLAPSAESGAWYPRRFLVPIAQNEPWLGEALAVVDGLVRELAAAGIDAPRVGLIGFSQGACLALEHTWRTGRNYGFVAALSGALIGPLGIRRPAVDLRGVPILLGCAEHDAHIPLEHVEESAGLLQAHGAAVTKQIYPGSAHTVFAPEIAWIDERLAAIRTGR